MKERLDPDHVDWLNAQIEKFPSRKAFYNAVYAVMVQQGNKPTDVETVKGAFIGALKMSERQRSLPRIYEQAMCVVLEIDEDSLPWRKLLRSKAPVESDSVAPAPLTTITPPGPSETHIVAPPATKDRSPGTKSPPRLGSHASSPMPPQHATARNVLGNSKLRAAQDAFSAFMGDEIERDEPMPPRGRKSLQDYLRTLSLKQIRRYIAPAAFASTARQVLKPECINVIAEKVVCLDQRAYFDFYSDDFGKFSDRIKRAVSDVIRVSEDMSELVIHIVLGVRDVTLFDIYRWFEVCAPFHSPEFIKFFEGFALSEILRLKYGKMHYKVNGLNRLTALLSYCVRFEAYLAVQGIIEVCLYKNLFYLREGAQR